MRESAGAEVWESLVSYYFEESGSRRLHGNSHECAPLPRCPCPSPPGKARLHSRLPPTKLLFQWQLQTWCFTVCCSPFCGVLFSSTSVELSGSRFFLWKLKQNKGATVSIYKKSNQREWTYFNPSSAYSIRSLASKSPFLTPVECLCSGQSNESVCKNVLPA